MVVDLVGGGPNKTACPGSGITAPYRIAFYGATCQCSKIGICSGAAADTCPLSVGSSPAAGISRKAKNRNTWLANMLAGCFFVRKVGGDMKYLYYTAIVLLAVYMAVNYSFGWILLIFLLILN